MKLFLSCEGLAEETAQSTQILELAEQLEKRGHAATIYAPRTRKYRGEKKTKIIYTPSIDVFLIRSLTYQLTLLIAMLRQKTKPDIIYTRMGVFSVAPLIYSKLIKKPHITHFPDNIAEDMEMEKTNKLIVSGYKLIEKINCLHSKAITTPTQGIKDHLVKTYKLPENKVTVIPNAANTEHFKPMDQEACRKELGLGNNPIIGFVGGLAPWQGLEYLIQAAPQILEKIPDAEFIIVGDGPQKEELLKQTQNQKLENKIKFTGKQPYNKIPTYINAFDICVVLKKPMTSGYSPLKLYEYLACGKPVIASDLPGFELLKEERIGLVICPGDVDAIASSVVSLLGDEARRMDYGQRGRRYAEEKNSWGANADRLINLSKSL